MGVYDIPSWIRKKVSSSRKKKVLGEIKEMIQWICKKEKGGTSSTNVWKVKKKWNLSF